MTPDQWTTIIGAAIASLLSGGLATSVVMWWLNRPKQDAETEKIEAETTQISVETETSVEDKLFGRQQAIIDRQDAKLADQENKIINLEASIRSLMREVEGLRVEAMKTKRYEAALVYIVNEVKGEYPVAVQISQKIAAGELILPFNNGTTNGTNGTSS